MTESSDEHVMKMITETDANQPYSSARQSTYGISNDPNTSKRKSTRKSVIDSLRTSVVHVTLPILKFYDIFGMAGYGMLAVFLLSTIWTLVLAAIQVEPAKMANTIMNTTNYDGGEFWLLPVHDKYVQVLSIIFLLLIGIGYSGLAALMIFPNRLHPVKRAKPVQPVSKLSTIEREVNLVEIKLQEPHEKGFSLVRLQYELFYPNGLLHHSFVSGIS